MYRLARSDPVLGDIGPHPHQMAQEGEGASPDGAEISHERIAATARRIWESEGRPPDREAEHWHKAEQRLKATTLPLLNLGDIFTNDASSPLLMVVNAACDLLFSPRSPDRQGRP